VPATLNAPLVILISLWLAVVSLAGWWWWTMSVRGQTLRRLLEFNRPQVETVELERSWLGWWLYRAGFRSATAVTTFLSLTGICVLVAAGLLIAIQQSGLVALWSSVLYQIPGAVGEVFLPLAWGSPWIAGIMVAAIPAIVVHQRRKRRIAEVEQDLPTFLDLLATLAEAGLGFDSALDRILESHPRQRTLSVEFRAFQLDSLAGRTRVQALRRLMQRVDVPWFSIFLSAVIQAEQIGSGLAQTLKIQADDLRNRRRERALALAMSIPVKLLLPLIVCFLPGIMVAAVGPTAYQLVQMLDGVLRNAGLGAP
jgi:tight adherence protein C